MSEKRKPLPGEVWDAIQDMAMADKAREVRGMSAEELDQSLAAKGIDPQKLRARAIAMAAKASQAKRPEGGPQTPQPHAAPSVPPQSHVEPTSGAPAEPAGKVVKMRLPVRTRWAALLAAATLALLVAALFVPAALDMAGAGKHPVDMAGAGRSRARDKEAAAELRGKAFEACDAKRWKQCADRLDQARELDPRGEDLPEVQDRRRQIERAR